MTNPTLSPQQRQHLLDTLAGFPLFVGDDGRTLLLANLPELSHTLVRSSSPLIDLATMVDTAASWGTPAQGRPALLVLIETALGLLVGSQAWQAVDSIRQELTTPTIRGQIFVGPPAAPHALILTPDGQQAFTWSTDEVLRRWDLAASTPPTDIAVHQGGIRTMAAAPDGQGFYLVGDAGTLEYWSFATPHPTPVAAVTRSGITALALLPTGQAALVGTYTGQVLLLRLADGTIQQTFTAPGMSTGHSGAVQAALVTADGRCFTATNLSVRQWNPVTGRELIHYTIPPSRWLAVTFLPDGLRLLFSTGDAIQTRIWDLAHQRVLTDLLLPGKGPLTRALTVNPAGTTLAAGRADGSLGVWTLDAA